MSMRTKTRRNEIVRAGSSALAVRSAALVARGLRDLARYSNWLVKRVAIAHSARLAISAAGQVAAASRTRTEQSSGLAIYDIESGALRQVLSAPDETPVRAPEMLAALAWSATGEHLVAAWKGWRQEFHWFDLGGTRFAGTFGSFPILPESVAWSEMGKCFAASWSGGTEARLRLWGSAREANGRVSFSSDPVGEVDTSAWPRWSQQGGAGDQPAGESSTGTGATLSSAETEESVVRGFGCAAFSPNEMQLASAIEMEGDWTDDALVLLEVPSLQKRSLWHAQGRITDLAWTHDSRGLIFCSGGQAYRLAPEGLEPESLPFGAELCACHPHLPICLCFSSWLRSSAKGRLFLVDLQRLEVFDEHAADGIADVCWSLDGSKAYAVTNDGLAYIYEPPPL